MNIVYICSRCKKESIRIDTGNEYVHPCIHCNSKMIKCPYDYKTYKKMKKTNEWNAFVESFIKECKDNLDYKQQPQKDYSYLKVQQKNDIKNLPKCPTCGSTNIRRIGATERGANALMFGLLGNKRKCQFECQNPNCRYRW